MIPSKNVKYFFVSEPDKRHIVNQFEDLQSLSEDEGPQFNNLVVDKNTGRVYIGAVNKLYQLSPNLEPMVSYVCKFIRMRIHNVMDQMFFQ